MELLKVEVRKNGCRYTMVDRTNKAAMYEQYDKDVFVGYEVFLIKKQKAINANMGGVEVSYQEKEAFPGNERFGVDAWSFGLCGQNREEAQKRALSKFMEISF